MALKQTKSLEEIRVMRIIARLNVGGPAIHVALVTAGINTPPFISKLVAGQLGPTEGDMSYLAYERGVRPIYIPELGREVSLTDDITALRKLIQLMRAWRPHIVHTHTAKAGFLGRLAAFLCGVPLIIHTFHGHVFRGYFGSAKTLIFIWLERISTLYTDVVLTISEKLRTDLVHYRIAPASKIALIPLGLELVPLTTARQERGSLRNEFGFSNSDIVIGSVGRLVPIKNQRLFLSAAQKIADVRSGWRFVIVGDGEMREDLESYAKDLRIRDRVIFAGWRRDLVNIYSDLDLLVLCSDNEGTPVSILEAMAAGVPVVATSVGGVPDILQGGHLGRLVEPGNADALAEAIIETLESVHPEMQSAAQQFVLERYDSERLIADLRALYLERLARKGYKLESSL